MDIGIVKEVGCIVVCRVVVIVLVGIVVEFKNILMMGGICFIGFFFVCEFVKVGY